MLKVIAADMLFLVGGGRAIDEGKEIATILDKPHFTFPTLASTNCAPVTEIAVFYKRRMVLQIRTSFHSLLTFLYLY